VIATIHHGDCLELLRAMPDNTADGLLSDPPAGIGFMSKAWDKDKGGRDEWIKWLAAIMREACRVMKPGAYGLVWALPRTAHWTTMALEDAGFEVRDVVLHLFGCLSDDTEILIDGEWRHFTEATAGRSALCYDPSTGGFAWQEVQKLHTYDHDDTAYRIHSAHTDQVVTRQHRCLVERGGAYVFEFAEDAAHEREARVPVLEDVRGLLAAVPYVQPIPSHSKQGVQSGVRRRSPSLGAESAQAEAGVPRMRRYLSTEESNRTLAGAVLFEPMQGDLALPHDGYEGIGLARSPRMEGPDTCGRDRQDDGPAQPGVEGRRYDLPQTRKLLGRDLCPMPGDASIDGEARRLRHGAPADRGDGHWSTAHEGGDGSPREPRSDRQPAREPHALRDESRSQTIRAPRFTVADLATFEPVHYRGIVWCVTVPTGAFVARRNGKVFVTGNSGFPKSLDVSKAIDSAAGATRAVTGSKITGRALGGSNWRDGDAGGQERVAVTAPATDLARQWEGYGTATKPAAEHWILVRKPLDGTVAANVAKWGTGGIAIDACRIDLDEGADLSARQVQSRNDGAVSFGSKPGFDVPMYSPLGRWPANVTLSEDAARELDAQAGDHPGMSGGGTHATDYAGGMFGSIDAPHLARNDSGGPSRFFYVAKATSFERNFGCEDLPVRTAAERVDRDEDSAGMDSPRAGAGRTGGARNHHPTIKSISLTKWLATLILPPAGRERRLLCPFAGSGGEVIGAMRAGWEQIDGIEQDADFVTIARARVARWSEVAAHLEPDEVEQQRADARQVPLFAKESA